MKVIYLTLDCYGEYPAGEIQWFREGSKTAVQILFRVAETTGSGTVFHDHNYTASRVSTSKSEAVLATSPWLIDQLMASTSFSSLQWTVSPGMHVSEAISWPSAESAWLICLGLVPAPCWAPYRYPHILTLFLPEQWIPEGLLTSPAALMEESAWTWGCMPEHVDQRVLESTAWSLNLLSAPSLAECWVTLVEFLQYLCTVYSTIYVLWGYDLLGYPSFVISEVVRICLWHLWSLPHWQMEEGIFCKIDSCMAESFHSDLSLKAYQLGSDWIMLTACRAYSPTLKLKYLIQYLRSLELLSKTE